MQNANSKQNLISLIKLVKIKVEKHKVIKIKQPITFMTCVNGAKDLAQK